jgi:hypothetical protein
MDGIIFLVGCLFVGGIARFTVPPALQRLRQWWTARQAAKAPVQEKESVDNWADEEARSMAHQGPHMPLGGWKPTDDVDDDVEYDDVDDFDDNEDFDEDFDEEDEDDEGFDDFDEDDEDEDEEDEDEEDEDEEDEEDEDEDDEDE